MSHLRKHGVRHAHRADRARLVLEPHGLRAPGETDEKRQPKSRYWGEGYQIGKIKIKINRGSESDIVENREASKHYFLETIVKNIVDALDTNFVFFVPSNTITVHFADAERHAQRTLVGSSAAHSTASAFSICSHVGCRYGAPTLSLTSSLDVAPVDG